MFDVRPRPRLGCRDLPNRRVTRRKTSDASTRPERFSRCCTRFGTCLAIARLKRIAWSRRSAGQFRNAVRFLRLWAEWLERAQGGASPTAPNVAFALRVERARPPDEADEHCNCDRPAADRERVQHAHVIVMLTLAARGVERADGLVTVWAARNTHSCVCRAENDVRPISHGKTLASTPLLGIGAYRPARQGSEVKQLSLRRLRVRRRLAAIGQE